MGWGECPQGEECLSVVVNGFGRVLLEPHGPQELVLLLQVGVVLLLHALLQLVLRYRHLRRHLAAGTRNRRLVAKTGT